MGVKGISNFYNFGATWSNSRLLTSPFKKKKENDALSFMGTNNKNKKIKIDSLPKIDIETKQEKHPGNLPDVSLFLRKKIITQANKMAVSVDDYLRKYLKHLTYERGVEPEPSKTANIGRTKVTTLIDAEQIFDKTVEMLKGAEKSIQIEMFEFQNLKVDGHKWPSKGAEIISGWEEQQQILDILITKKRSNPEMKIQVILDAHKWYMDGYGAYDRHYNNQNMIKYLFDNGIDVVPYPRAAQQGAGLQHVKFVAVDTNKALIGGMNFGTHSSANHDACVYIETRPEYKHSEVDNMIEKIFNRDWKFSWQRLGKTKLVAGPLNEEEQKIYSRLQKEIKPENVDYMNIVGRLYDTEHYRTRYERGDLDLIPVTPIDNPEIKVLTNKPLELKYVDENGSETIGKYIKEKVKKAKKIRAELFVLSHKEIIGTVIKRHKEGKLDAQFIVSSDILEQFPYCRKAYQNLVNADVPVRLYKSDKRIEQRLHCKWAVFDDEELLIGSANWSAVGLEQNLKKGMREDYELIVKQLNKEIKNYIGHVSRFESELGIPNIGRNHIDYKELLDRKRNIKKAIKEIPDQVFVDCKIGDETYTFSESDLHLLQSVQGYYKLIQKTYNRKQKYKRGNNESAIAFISKKLSNVFLRQFDKDWKYSESEYEKSTAKVLDIAA